MNKASITGARTRALMVIGALLAGCLAVAFVPTAASAQDICDEYPDLPQCEGPGGGGDDDDGDEGPTGGGGGGGPTGTLGAGDGDLPFTGYPMTPLVLLLLALVALGLAIRTATTMRGRARTRRAGGHGNFTD